MTSHTSPERLNAVDALRGFALAGIVVAHVLEQFIAAPRPANDWWVESNLADTIISGLSFFLVSGKFYSMFAVLFGMSFAIMMGNAAQRGSSFSGRFVWRLTILAVFGFLHALVYRGDILTVYVLIGLVLPVFYRVPSKWLWIIAGLLFVGLGRWLFFLFTGKTSLLPYPMTPESPVVHAYVDVLKTGTFWDVVKINFTQGFASKYDFQLGIVGRGYLTLAYFLVGMWLVRAGIMHKLEDYKKKIRLLMFCALGSTVVSIGLMAATFSTIVDQTNLATWGAVFAFTFFSLTNVSLTAFLMCGFLLLYLRWPTGWLASFAPYGRMALSNYLMQSLIGTFVLFGWGLGMLGEFHDWQMLIFAFLLIFFQIRLSLWWLSKFQYGPLEWLWRCATYFKAVKLRKTVS